MAKKTYRVAAVIALGAVLLSVPALTLADDRGGKRSMKHHGMKHHGMMQGGLMDGMFPGGMMREGFDFATIDADGDGKITRAEIDAHRQSQIAGLDADGDNLISAEEMTAFATARMQDRIAEMAAARIAARDTDSDGKLSAAEMMAPAGPARMFERADADGDGAVSEDEIAAMKERMSAMRGQRAGGGQGRMGHDWFGMDDMDDEAGESE